jgi:anti-sigma B factor antagonist
MEPTKDGIVRFAMVGNVATVNFQRGRIREEREILKALEDLGKYIETHPKINLLLNLENIEYLSSAGLGNLVGLLKKSRRSSGQFKLCRLQEPILELFEVMRLTKIFEIFETEEAAVRSFNPEKQAEPVR